jgi:hypothetical protein
MLLLKSLFGDCVLNTHTHFSAGADALGKPMARYNISSGAGPLTRLGGLTHVYEGVSPGPVALFEIALIPPLRTPDDFSAFVNAKGAGKGVSTVALDDSSLGRMFTAQSTGAIIHTETDLSHGFTTEPHVASYSGFGNAHVGRVGLALLRQKVGGLDKQIATLIRRVFATRKLPAQKLIALGVPHVRGVLLYGPPGCGKTLLAREISSALTARQAKIVSGPEVLDK